MDNSTTSSLVNEGQYRGFPQLPWDDDELDLKQLITVLRRRAWLIGAIAAGVMVTVILNTVRQEPVYEGSFQVLVEPVNADNKIQDFSELLGDNAPSPSSGLDYETQVQVLRSPRLIEQVLTQLRATQPAVDPAIDYETLLENLTIRRVNETKIIEVLYQGQDPETIQQTLDVLADVYLDYSLRERQTNLRQGIQFVNKQLPELQGRVDQLQSELETFRKVNNFIDPTTQNAQIVSQSDGLSTQRLDIDRQLAQARTAYELLDGAGGEAALQNAEVYQQLIADLREIEAEIAANLTRFQPSSLRIQVLQEQRERLLPVLAAEAQRVIGARTAGAINDIQVLETQSQTLAQAENQLQSTLTELPTLAREYSDLQRELEIAVRALSRFLETRETLQIEAAQTEIPWELIEAPIEPTDPIAPSVKRSLLLGAVASVLLGVGTALLLEKLDSVCRTVDELKGTLKLPLLGVVPYQQEFDDSADSDSPDWLSRLNVSHLVPFKPGVNGHYGYGSSQFLEAMRLLQTNLLLLGAERPIQSIVMSSSVPGEGKSTVARHLAQTAATMGKRVLLVDADMRRPVIEKRLGLDHSQGLSDLLSGNAEKSEVIQRAMPFVEFYTITAGSIPPDPVKLLSSRRMQQLMTELEQDFDLIIYDSPPLVGLADTTLIAPHTDGVILVARIHKCDRDVLGYVTENIHFSKIPVLGMVANGVIPDGKSYKYYAYGYETSAIDTPHGQPDPSQNGGPPAAKAPQNGGTSGAKQGLNLADFSKYRK
ncbi:MAG: GumC family protein [Leptolyngbyaceae cyanobacterium]